MATFVLVPGFWLGAWAWEDVTRELRAAGHDVHPVTLPGLADRVDEATPEVDVETHIADLVRLVEGDDLREVVLVGHSGANVPVTALGDRIPERIARVVYVDAGPMPAGASVLDSNPPEVQDAWRKSVASDGDGWRLPLPDFGPEDLAGLDDGQLARMRAMSTPQPFGTLTQPLRRPDVLPDVPRSVIATTFTPEDVRAMVDSGDPKYAVMAGVDVHHLPTGHWPMFSRPTDLAALLADLAT
ncbi:alpha/beta fold hydrolase [Saccharopolyspora sp. WRP15-2]|uniref:Alpha/beta fold hydrolase n=1 Tax=Saccharopolyspora oryzae TaxID=2997343 RepID=A0ABT4UXH8_9PSEU|nr:alpha/beta fold hydrolase [Saccharopolyspora oryzae]MDA3625839.1 alpha/beta fold hydrolase [Saccharopolyspora oryzae]